MKDFQNRLERLQQEVEECELIANLATDEHKRAVFKRLVMRYRAMIEELRADFPKAS